MKISNHIGRGTYGPGVRCWGGGGVMRVHGCDVTFGSRMTQIATPINLLNGPLNTSICCNMGMCSVDHFIGR